MKRERYREGGGEGEKERGRSGEKEEERKTKMQQTGPRFHLKCANQISDVFRHGHVTELRKKRRDARNFREPDPPHKKPCDLETR